MLKEYLDSVKLGIVECLFEKIGPGATFKEIKSYLPRSTKNIESSIAELVSSEVIVCEGEGEGKIYRGNRRSKIFTALFNIDVELSDQAYVRKRRLRAQMMAPPKKVESSKVSV